MYSSRSRMVAPAMPRSYSGRPFASRSHAAFFLATGRRFQEVGDVAREPGSVFDRARRVFGGVLGAQIHLEGKTANPDPVAVVQVGLLHPFAVHGNPVQAVQVDYLPGPVRVETSAMPAADVGQRQAQVGVGVP